MQNGTIFYLTEGHSIGLSFLGKHNFRFLHKNGCKQTPNISSVFKLKSLDSNGFRQNITLSKH